MRVFFLLIVLAFSGLMAQPVVAETRTIGTTDYTIAGVRISKSGSARLADIRSDSHPITERSIFLPAGTKLLVLDHLTTDRKGRPWTLAVTGAGLLVYVRTDDTHMLDANVVANWAKKGRPFAIAQTNFEVDTQTYGRVTITPTEIYDFTYLPEEAIRITIGQLKMGASYDGDEAVSVPIDNFEIIEPRILDPRNIPSPFAPYDALDELRAVLESAADLNVTEEEKQAFLDAIKSFRLVDDKDCRTEVVVNLKAGASVSLDTDKLFSPIAAKLGLTGDFTSTTKFSAGTEIEVSRFQRAGQIIEIREEEVFDATCIPPMKSWRMTVGELNHDAVLTTDIITKLALQKSPSGLPIYTCREEYLKLLRFLTTEEGISFEAAVLATAFFARFEASQNAATCRS